MRSRCGWEADAQCVNLERTASRPGRRVGISVRGMVSLPGDRQLRTFHPTKTLVRRLQDQQRVHQPPVPRSPVSALDDQTLNANAPASLRNHRPKPHRRSALRTKETLHICALAAPRQPVSLPTIVREASTERCGPDTHTHFVAVCARYPSIRISAVKRDRVCAYRRTPRSLLVARRKVRRGPSCVFSAVCFRRLRS